MNQHAIRGTDIPGCPRCASRSVRKKGIYRHRQFPVRQKWLCKSCGLQFVVQHFPSVPRSPLNLTCPRCGRRALSMRRSRQKFKCDVCRIYFTSRTRDFYKPRPRPQSRSPQLGENYSLQPSSLGALA